MIVNETAKHIVAENELLGHRLEIWTKAEGLSPDNKFRLQHQSHRRASVQDSREFTLGETDNVHK